MDFTEATDRLGADVTHADVAKALGVSVQTVRQARLRSDSRNYRRPPDGWPAALAKLARRKAAELVALAQELEGR